MKWLEKFESRYSLFYRIAFAVVVLVTLAGVLLIGLYWGQSRVTGEHKDASTLLSAPTWQDIRLEVLPVESPRQDGFSQHPTQPSASQPSRPPLDKRIEEIHRLLSLQFERNPGGVQRFQELVPKRLLQERLLEPGLISLAWTDRFLSEAITFANVLSKDPLISRIGKLEDRADTLLKALDRYTIAFSQAISTAEEREMALLALDEERKARVDLLVMKVIPGSFIALLLILFLVTFLRLEVHLRAIAASMGNRDRHDAGS